MSNVDTATRNDESHSERAERYLSVAAKRARSNDAATAALIGSGYALLTLAGGDFPTRWIESTVSPDVDALRSWGSSTPTAVRARHGVDECGWDFDALADLLKPALAMRDRAGRVVDADQLAAWFTANGLDIDELGGRS